METPAGSIEALVDRVEAYGRTTFELSKLKLLETLTHVVSLMIPRISVILVMSLSLLVLNIGIALWLGDLLGKFYFGFFIVAGFYLVAGIILHIFMYKWIQKPISEFIIKQVLYNEES